MVLVVCCKALQLLTTSKTINLCMLKKNEHISDNGRNIIIDCFSLSTKISFTLETLGIKHIVILLVMALTFYLPILNVSGKDISFFFLKIWLDSIKMRNMAPEEIV